MFEIRQVIEFATHAHAFVGQRRKYTGEPYIVHPYEVACIVEGYTDDIATIATAWLHDVLEDTRATEAQLKAFFGEEVASLVKQLTNIAEDHQGNRAVRAAIDLEHLAKASPKAQTVKLADLISNMGSIVERDPVFARVWLKETGHKLEVLTSGDSQLYKRTTDLYDEAMNHMEAVWGGLSNSQVKRMQQELHRRFIH